VFLYALRREVVRNVFLVEKPIGEDGFYTPFGVRWFGTPLHGEWGRHVEAVSIRPSA